MWMFLLYRVKISSSGSIQSCHEYNLVGLLMGYETYVIPMP